MKTPLPRVSARLWLGQLPETWILLAALTVLFAADGLWGTQSVFGYVSLAGSSPGLSQVVSAVRLGNYLLGGYLCLTLCQVDLRSHANHRFFSAAFVAAVVVLPLTSVLLFAEDRDAWANLSIFGLLLSLVLLFVAAMLSRRKALFIDGVPASQTCFSSASVRERRHRPVSRIAVVRQIAGHMAVRYVLMALVIVLVLASLVHFGPLEGSVDRIYTSSAGYFAITTLFGYFALVAAGCVFALMPFSFSWTLALASTMLFAGVLIP